MTRIAAQTTAPQRIGDCLLTDEKAARRPMARALQRVAEREPHARTITALEAACKRALAAEVVAKLHMALGDRLADVIVEGWHGYAALRDGVRWSLDHPGADRTVCLDPHEVDATRGYTVHVDLDHFPSLSVTAAVVLTLRVTEASAKIRDGWLVAATPGTAQVTAGLTVEGETIAHRTLTVALGSEETPVRPVNLAACLA